MRPSVTALPAVDSGFHSLLFASALYRSTRTVESIRIESHRTALEFVVALDATDSQQHSLRVKSGQWEVRAL